MTPDDRRTKSFHGVIPRRRGEPCTGGVFLRAHYVKSLIVMPKATAILKFAGTRFGGEVLLHGALLRSESEAIELAQRQGFTGAAV